MVWGSMLGQIVTEFVASAQMSGAVCAERPPLFGKLVGSNHHNPAHG